jgi:TRAP-type C4-dicarboxylate transport system permease small subunit
MYALFDNLEFLVTYSPIVWLIFVAISLITNGLLYRSLKKSNANNYLKRKKRIVTSLFVTILFLIALLLLMKFIKEITF